MRKAMLSGVWMVAAIGFVVAAIYCASIPFMEVVNRPSTRGVMPSSASSSASLGKVLQQELAITMASQSNNVMAVQKGIKEVNQVFEDMKRGVPAFVEDVYGLKTKAKIVGKGALDLWPWQENRARVRTMMESKFAQHVMTTQQLVKLIGQVNRTFATALVENRNRLALTVSSNLKSVLPTGMRVDEKMVSDAMNRETEASIKPLLIRSLGGEAASLVLAEVVTMVVVNAVGRVAVVASAAAVGGWATFGIGLVVAVAVDLYMSHEAKAAMTATLYERIDAMRDAILNGVDRRPGFAKTMRAVAAAVHMAELNAVSNTIVACYR